MQFILCSLPSTWISSEQLQVFICSSLFYKPLSFTITLLTFHCLVFCKLFSSQAFCTSSKNVCKGKLHFLFYRIVILSDCDILSSSMVILLGSWKPVMLDRNCLQWKHLRMVNMLTDRIKMLNDINKMEQSAETNKLDK